MGRSRKASEKREEGLKKKARELATLCGVDVCLVGVAPDGSFFCWPDDISEVGRIAKRYLEAVGGSSNDGEEPALSGTKRKRAAAAAGETASCRSLVPRPKRAKGSQRGMTADTRVEQERTQGQGSDSGVRVAGSPDLHLDFAPAMALHPDITVAGAADIGWLTIPPLAPSPSSAMLSCPAAAELGYDRHLLGESVLGCGGHIGEFLLHLSDSSSQDASYDLGLLSAVDGGSTLGIPDEAFFHTGALVDTSEVSPPETVAGVGYDPALSGVSACHPSAVFGSSGGSDSGIMDPLGMAAAGLYDDDAEAISLLLLPPSWELLHASL